MFFEPSAKTVLKKNDIGGVFKINYQKKNTMITFSFLANNLQHLQDNAF